MTIDATVTSAKPAAKENRVPTAGSTALATVGSATNPSTSEPTVTPSCVPDK